MSLEANILRKYRRIVVIGATSDPAKPGNFVPAYLQEHGYEVVPVNPNEDEVLGQKSYPDLASVPGPIEVVELFRRSEHVGPHVDEAIRLGARTIWMQSGIKDEAAAERAQAAGLEVVMDRCMKTEHRRLGEKID